VWLAFALFDAFFSNRPYTHYLLTMLVPFSLLIGFAFEKRQLLKITVPALIIIYILVNSSFSFYKKEISYYQNFLAFLSGGSVTSYQNFFDSHTSQDYDIANFVRANTNKNEGIFLWGDGSQIYALSGKLPPGRYAAAYHITTFKNAISETKDAIEKTAPKFIIQTKEDSAISNFLDGYQFKYKVDNAIIYERQF
jgi:hypothetical protein